MKPIIWQRERLSINRLQVVIEFGYYALMLREWFKSIKSAAFAPSISHSGGL
jgi:hypothetical protein